MLDKAALVLGTFPGGSMMSLNDVCRQTGLARSTTHRLLVDLVDLGWVVRNGRHFELGMPLFELGERVAVKHRLRSAAMPFMQDLFAVTKWTVHLAVRDGTEVVYVEKLQGHMPLPLPSHIGGRLPLSCTGVGKALLAFDDTGIRSTVLSRPLHRLTSRSIVDPGVLEKQLDDIRRTGVAIEREEATTGGCCAASAIVVSGAPVAALSVSVPVDKFKPELLAPAVRTAALALSRVLSRVQSDPTAIPID